MHGMKQVVQLFIRDIPSVAIHNCLEIFFRGSAVKKGGRLEHHLAASIKISSDFITVGIMRESSYKTTLEEKIFIADPSFFKEELVLVYFFWNKGIRNFFRCF